MGPWVDVVKPYVGLVALARARRRRAYRSPDCRQKSVRTALHCFDFASHRVVYYNVYICLQ
jgi:hypothetical protein